LILYKQVSKNNLNSSRQHQKKKKKKKKKKKGKGFEEVGQWLSLIHG
jgi:hypothetical protein